MARPLGSGPILVYLGFGPPTARPFAPAPVTAAGALYYGTTRSGIDTGEDLSFYKVMNDLTGPVQSLDEGYAGREDDIVCLSTAWTQSVDNMLEHFLDPLNAINPIGTDQLSDLGTLMLSEGKTLGLWLVKQAALKPINVAAGMARGRYYPTVIMTGPNKKVEGNKECMISRVFRAKKDINSINLGKLPLFHEDNASFLGLPAPTFG
jgi:hypothetical protein